MQNQYREANEIRALLERRIGRTRHWKKHTLVPVMLRRDICSFSPPRSVLASSEKTRRHLKMSFETSIEPAWESFYTVVNTNEYCSEYSTIGCFVVFCDFQLQDKSARRIKKVMSSQKDVGVVIHCMPHYVLIYSYFSEPWVCVCTCPLFDRAVACPSVAGFYVCVDSRRVCIKPHQLSHRWQWSTLRRLLGLSCPHIREEPCDPCAANAHSWDKRI